MAVTLRKNTKGLTDLKRKIAQLQKSAVEVGWFSDAVYDGSGTGPGRGRRDEGYNAGMQVAEVALIQDEGSFDVPPQHFMDHFVQGVIRDANRLGSEIESAVTKNVPIGTQSIAKRLKQQLKEVVEMWSNWHQNSPATIEAKGFDDYLEDTGVMLDSIDSRVKGQAGKTE